MKAEPPLGVHGGGTDGISDSDIFVTGLYVKLNDLERATCVFEYKLCQRLVIDQRQKDGVWRFGDGGRFDVTLPT